jgi:hypothetical protein
MSDPGDDTDSGGGRLPTISVMLVLAGSALVVGALIDMHSASSQIVRYAPVNEYARLLMFRMQFAHMWLGVGIFTAAIGVGLFAIVLERRDR